jgi:hypothetical protein
MLRLHEYVVFVAVVSITVLHAATKAVEAYL